MFFIFSMFFSLFVDSSIKSVYSIKAFNEVSVSFISSCFFVVSFSLLISFCALSVVFSVFLSIFVFLSFLFIFLVSSFSFLLVCSVVPRFVPRFVPVFSVVLIVVPLPFFPLSVLSLVFNFVV